MMELKYLMGYPKTLLSQVEELIHTEKLGTFLKKRYPKIHSLNSDKALYNYAMEIKNRSLKKSVPLSRVSYCNKMTSLYSTLGLQKSQSRVHGSKLKSHHEIQIASVFKRCPEEFLRMIVVHEVVHLKEKEHNKAFYKLCHHIEPAYQQYEFDMRLYLTHLDIVGELY